MTPATAFTPQEWDLILMGPTSAGMMVMTAQRGGVVRESLSIAKAYADARRRHGNSELFDAIIAATPKVDRSGSIEELPERAVADLRGAVAVLERKATSEELAAYQGFVVTLAREVARAHGEGAPADEAASASESSAVDAIADALYGPLSDGAVVAR